MFVLFNAVRSSGIKSMKASRVFVVASVAIFGCAASVSFDQSARAATSTANLTIQAIVPALCIITGNSINFGTVSQNASSQTSSLGVLCTNTTPYTIGLGNGAGAGATGTNRLMTSGTGTGAPTLAYRLTSDSAGANNWGATTALGAVSGVGTGALVSVPVYGFVAAPGANALYTPGTYNDTVLATLTY